MVSPCLLFSGPPSSLNPGSRPLPSLSSSITYIHPFPAVLNHRNAKFLTRSFINVLSLSFPRTRYLCTLAPHMSLDPALLWGWLNQVLLQTLIDLGELLQLPLQLPCLPPQAFSCFCLCTIVQVPFTRKPTSTRRNSPTVAKPAIWALSLIVKAVALKPASICWMAGPEILPGLM